MPESPPPPAVVNQSECPTDWRELWAEQTSWSFIALVTVLLFFSVMGCFLCAVFLARKTLARQGQSRSSQLFVRNVGSPPQLKLPQECKWHLFLSHTWANGQDQCAKIKTGLRLCVRRMKIFLDVDDLEDLQFLERDIKATAAKRHSRVHVWHDWCAKLRIVDCSRGASFTDAPTSAGMLQQS